MSPVTERHDSFTPEGEERSRRWREVHDCEKDHCYTDRRTQWQVEAEGFEAARNGATYSDNPYGHTHPDHRFNWWLCGWEKQLGEWCYTHSSSIGWCQHEHRRSCRTVEGSS